MTTPTFQLGELVVYEHKRPNDGRKHMCRVVGVKDGWVLDADHGTSNSSSFKPDDVIVWEVLKPRKPK